MKQSIVAAILALSLCGACQPVLAQPASHSTARTGPNGGTLQGSSSVSPVRGGVAGQAQGSWSGPHTSGSANASGTYQNGVVNGSGSATVTNKATGNSTTVSGTVNYSQSAGGTVTTTSPRGTNSYTLRPH